MHAVSFCSLATLHLRSRVLRMSAAAAGAAGAPAKVGGDVSGAETTRRVPTRSLNCTAFYSNYYGVSCGESLVVVWGS
jgi:hypothetical protein